MIKSKKTMNLPPSQESSLSLLPVRTEREKMLAGELYDCGDPELITRWHEAKRLQHSYNNTPSTESKTLSALLDQLLGSRGDSVWITAPFFVDYGNNIHLGNHIEINMNCVFLDVNRIEIGDHSGIGPGVHIYTVFHPLPPEERLSFGADGEFSFWKSQSSPVRIGRNVWIGGGSIILPGVTIGDGTTIGAGSVVTRSIPPRCIAYGNPCRVVRYLDEESKLDKKGGIDSLVEDKESNKHN